MGQVPYSNHNTSYTISTVCVPSHIKSSCYVIYFFLPTVHLLMTYMEGNLTDSVTLLTVHPLMINGTEVEGFQEYIPDDT